MSRPPSRTSTATIELGSEQTLASTSPRGGSLRDPGSHYRLRMCRSIKPLFNFEPPVTTDEVQAAALQYVRKVSGYRDPSRVNQETFAKAVDEVTEATRRLVDSLVTSAPKRDREVEAEKARARAARRYATR